MKFDLKKKFLLIFFLISVGAIIITAFHEFYFQRKFVINKIKRIALNDLKLASKEILNLHQWIVKDVNLIKELPDFKNYLNYNFNQYRLKVEEDFLSIANTHKIYDQIRFLDLFGYEKIRINFDGNSGYIVSQKNLQYKGHRYYFKEAQKLKRGEIYISPLDLNIENNKIEVPYKPAIRYITPVFNSAGIKKGYLVLNILGCEILKKIAQRQKQKFGDYYFINKEGYYLFHPDFSKTFGFMFNKTSKEYRYDIDLLKNKESGIIKEKTGFFQNIQLSLFYKIKIAPCRYWYLIHSIKYNSIFPEFQQYFKHILILIFIMFILCIFPAGIFALRFITPLKELTEKAEKIKNGDLDVKVKVYSDDELGKFCETFNQMIEKLKQTEEFKRKLREEITLAEEKERKNIGEFIHEELAQDIAFLNFKIREIQQKECLNSEKDLKLLQNITQKIIKKIRNTIFELYPAILYEHGLIEAIQWYIPIFMNKTGINITFTKKLEAPLNLSKSQEIYIFRAIKELLNNIWKHANAKEVVISIFNNENSFKLIIDDDGVGFDTEKVMNSNRINGIGLFSIKQWVNDMNGNLIIESQKGLGTRVIIEIKGNKYD